MKKIVLIIGVIMGATLASAQSNIAHLNSQEIMETMPSYQDAVSKMKAFEQDGVLELQAMQKNFETAIQEYSTQVQSGSLTPVLQQNMEQRLARKEQDLMERQQSLQNEMQQYSSELNTPVLEQLNKAIKTVSERLNYNYVFDVNTIIFYNGPDITQEVIAEVKRQ